MNQTSTRPIIQIRELRIATRGRLRPEFIDSPEAFAHSHNVALVDCVLPAVSFRSATKENENTEIHQVNIPLVRQGAIRLFVENDGDGDELRSIVINPAELLQRSYDEAITQDDLDETLRVLASQVAKLLANPHDVRHILPGMRGSESYWSSVEFRAYLLGLRIRHFHRLSHYLTGPAEGTIRKRIKLHRPDDCCTILFEKVRLPDAGDAGKPPVKAVAVTLTLKGHILSNLLKFKRSDIRKIHEVPRLVKIRAADAEMVFASVMNGLEGFYLPVPQEWESMGKPVTSAKVIPLLTSLTGIPTDELETNYAAIRNPSKDTLDRLEAGAKKAAACLKPIPVAALFDGIR